MKTSTLLPNFILILYNLWKTTEAFEQCKQTAVQGLNQSCICTEGREGYDVWCPDSEKPKVRFHVQPEALWVSCHELGIYVTHTCPAYS